MQTYEMVSPKQCVSCHCPDSNVILFLFFVPVYQIYIINVYMYSDLNMHNIFLP